MNDQTKGLLIASAGVTLLYFAGREIKRQFGVYPPLPPFTENRVRRDDYGQIPYDSPNLVSVDSSGAQQKVHILVARRLDALKREAAKDGFTNIKIASGWRNHKWRNWDHYVETLVNRYGSLAEGRRWVAYKSPHETGLAIDFGSNGLSPNSSTNDQQKQTPFYKWLVNNAHRFGFTPYKNEAWHWELKVPLHAWKSGDEFTHDYGVYV